MTTNQRTVWRSEREAAKQHADAILNTLQQEGRPPTEAETAELNRLNAQIDALSRKIAAWDEDELGQSRATRLQRQHPARSGIPRPGRARYADLFGEPAPVQSYGWESAEQFFAVLHSGRHDDRLQASVYSIATTGVGSEGGYSVPEELVARMLDASLEDEIVRPRATVEPITEGLSKRIWAFDASDSSATLYGGFTGQWVPEGGEITAQTPRLRQIRLEAKKLALLAEVSNELAADGTGYAVQLEQAITKAIGWFLDLAFLTGTGAGQPLGVLNDPALIVVAKETGQAPNTIVYENLAKMFARLHPASVVNSIWLANSTTIPQLLQLSIPVGTGGSHIPVLTESNGQFRMLTRPVVFTEKLPALGSQGDILLADFSQYAIGLRRDMSLDQSQHVGFTRDTTHYRGIIRAEGMGKWQQAYVPKNGDSLSWCVTLAARS